MSRAHAAKASIEADTRNGGAWRYVSARGNERHAALDEPLGEL